MNITAAAATMGGDVRVGLEASFWGGPGKLAGNDAAQIKNDCWIVEGRGLEIGMPDEARKMLSWEGKPRRSLPSVDTDNAQAPTTTKGRQLCVSPAVLWRYR